MRRGRSLRADGGAVVPSEGLTPLPSTYQTGPVAAIGSPCCGHGARTGRRARPDGRRSGETVPPPLGRTAGASGLCSPAPPHSWRSRRGFLTRLGVPARHSSVTGPVRTQIRGRDQRPTCSWSVDESGWRNRDAGVSESGWAFVDRSRRPRGDAGPRGSAPVEVEHAGPDRRRVVAVRGRNMHGGCEPRRFSAGALWRWYWPGFTVGRVRR